MNTYRTVKLDCKTIVYKEHTLGVVYPHELQILRTSILRGSPHNNWCGTIAFDPILNAGDFRPATEKDFEEYGVVFNRQFLTQVEVPTFC